MKGGCKNSACTRNKPWHRLISTVPAGSLGWPTGLNHFPELREWLPRHLTVTSLWGRKGHLRRVKAKSQGHEDESANIEAQRRKGSGPPLAVSHPACPAHTVPVAPNSFGMKSNSSTWLRMPLMATFVQTYLPGFMSYYPFNLIPYPITLPCYRQTPVKPDCLTFPKLSLSLSACFPPPEKSFLSSSLIQWAFPWTSQILLGPWNILLQPKTLFFKKTLSTTIVFVLF